MSKGNYYSGSPGASRGNGDDGEWWAFILALIITGAITGIFFSVKSCTTDNKEEKAKIEQAIQKTKAQRNTIAWSKVVKSL